jgi:hypothetical protein
MTSATLGLKIDSRQVKRGAGDLDKLTGAAKRAEAATKGMGRAFQFAVRHMLAFGAARSAAFSLVSIFRFKDALAEVSTLVDTATFNMSELEGD